MFDRVPKCISLINIMSAARIFHRSTQDCDCFLKYKIFLSEFYIYIIKYIIYLLLNRKEFDNFFPCFLTSTA